MSDLLSRIDELTAPTGRCRFCDGDLCGSVSEDFCSELCQSRWARGGTGDEFSALELAAAWESAIATRVSGLRSLTEQLQPVFAGMADAIQQCAEVVRRFHPHVAVANGDPPPPADPMARALHLRRHRNTGPKLHADPRLNR